MQKLTKKRFVIQKSLIGKNVLITFINKKGDKMSYDHDLVYNTHKEKFDNMPCFNKYKSYTNTNTMPAFCRNLEYCQYLQALVVRKVDSAQLKNQKL